MMILEEYLDTFIIVYLNNVLIYSNDEEGHKRQIKQVLRKLNKAGMILNIEKCQFFIQEVKFLGRILSAEGLHLDPWNISKIIDWPTPVTLPTYIDSATPQDITGPSLTTSRRFQRP
jgi:Reverse transcriptase (RNA-dependent DNA polymerase)